MALKLFVGSISLVNGWAHFRLQNEFYLEQTKEMILNDLKIGGGSSDILPLQIRGFFIQEVWWIDMPPNVQVKAAKLIT